MRNFPFVHWYRDISLLNALYFAMSNNLSIIRALPNLPIPKLPKKRIQHSLTLGHSFAKALLDAGVPKKESAFFDWSGSREISLELLQLHARSAKMHSSLRACLAESFLYPDIIAILSVFCWFSFESVNAFQHSSSNLFFLCFLIVFFVLQILLFLPSFPLMGSLRLLQEAQILFVYLRCCFSRGVDEATAIRKSLEDLGLVHSIGKEASQLIHSGYSFQEVLMQMPAVRAIRFGVSTTGDIQGLLSTFGKIAEEEWNLRFEKLRISLRTLGLLFSGVLILILAVRVFLVMYKSGLECF